MSTSGTGNANRVDIAQVALTTVFVAVFLAIFRMLEGSHLFFKPRVAFFLITPVVIQLLLRGVFGSSMTRVIAGSVLWTLVSYAWSIYNQRIMVIENPLHRQTLNPGFLFTLTVIFSGLHVVVSEGIHAGIAAFIRWLRSAR